MTAPTPPNVAMTSPLQAAQIELAARTLSKRRFLPFVQRLNPRYMAGWVHTDICRRLEQFSDDVVKGLSPRLMLLMPPRSGKSELASRMFPSWHLGRHPDHEIIACAYNVSLAMSFSRKVKEAMDDPAYQSVFEARLHPDFRSNEEWALANGRGGYVAAGVGGGITGKGAHVLIIDDPIKNAEEADSADVREKLWDWYGSTAYTRLAPGGGVLCIQCMTGDTPVRLPDGTEKRLDLLRAGDEVATYDDGVLSTSRVAAWKSNGRDNVYTITMKSGKMVRANGRHPFLVSDGGELKWIRTKHLTTAHTIVVLSGSVANGPALPAPQRAVSSPPSAAASASRTTVSRSGPLGTALPLSTPSLSALGTSNTATVSPPPPTPSSWPRKAASALSAATSRMTARLGIGAGASVLTTTMTPVKSGDSSATTATLPLGTPAPSASPLRSLNTSDFTLDGVAHVTMTGIEEVFDVQIDRTENFIANGLVSHNTWWHDDDLAGRLQTAMATDDEADQFVVIKYPAIAEQDEFLDYDTDLIVYDEAPDNGRPLRAKGEALHPERYDLQKLNRIKSVIPPRFWAALYQQNPVPDDGAYFTKENFRRGRLPPLSKSNVFIAFDFAISEKKQNDYTVGVVGLQDEDDILHVAEVLRFKSGDGLFIVEAMLNLCQKWHNPSLVLGVEDGQIFRAIESLLKKRMRERKFYPSLTLLKPITDKLARARPLQGRMQQGMVSFNERAEWYDTARTEMLRFPAGAHDDQVDALAWMTTMAVGREPPAKPKVKEPDSWRKKLLALHGTVGHMAA